MHFGLLGFPLGHSFSVKFFKEKFSGEKIFEGWTYDNFEREDVGLFFKKEASTLDGFNVTIPHKRNVLPFLDSISDEAKKIGAVNCIKNQDGRFIGFNTDAFGFEQSLKSFLKEGNCSAGKSIPDYALILGSGGASRAVRYVLHKMGIEYDIVSRSGDINYENLDERLKRAGLVVNTTPLGTFPKTEGKPDLNYDLLTEEKFLYDLVYNPPLTSFLKEGEKRGCKIKSGTDMLHLQAEKSLEIWTS